MKIKYREPTIQNMMAVADPEAELLNIIVESIDDVPVADCVQEVKWAAASEVVDFLLAAKVLSVSSGAKTKSAGRSSKT